MTTSDQLIAALALNPSDSDLYLIVADLLEEEGQEQLARAYRWCGENGKSPHRDICEQSNRGWSWTHETLGPLPKWNHARLPYNPSSTVSYRWFSENLCYRRSFASVMQTLAEHFNTVVNIPTSTVNAG